VTITAGTAPTDATVLDAGTLPGGALPIGTVLWNNPGNGSGVGKLVPAVPSLSGVADVFAFRLVSSLAENPIRFQFGIPRISGHYRMALPHGRSRSFSARDVHHITRRRPLPFTNQMLLGT
jgi:hypothetical protein